MQVDSLLMLKRDRERKVHDNHSSCVNLQNYYISLVIARPKILAFMSDYDFLSRSSSFRGRHELIERLARSSTECRINLALTCVQTTLENDVTLRRRSGKQYEFIYWVFYTKPHVMSIEGERERENKRDRDRATRREWEQTARADRLSRKMLTASKTEFTRL